MATRTSARAASDVTRIKVGLMVLAAIVSLLGAQGLATSGSAIASVATASAP